MCGLDHGRVSCVSALKAELRKQAPVNSDPCVNCECLQERVDELLKELTELTTTDSVNNPELTTAVVNGVVNSSVNRTVYMREYMRRRRAQA